jgi:AraC-like DNA-binding protein
MAFIFEGRASNSPFVETIWRTHSQSGGSFISLAASQWEMVVTRQAARTTLTVRGPETKAVMAPIPENAEFFGIIFKLGTFMPHLPAKILVDREINLPKAANNSFWLNNSVWQFPDFENADAFIDRLARNDLLAREPVVEAALQGRLKDISLRSIQRRFLRATGLTYKTVSQIERARQAMALLQRGESILDTVHQTGFFDQPHLTKSLKYLVGQTPAQIARLSQPA